MTTYAVVFTVRPPVPSPVAEVPVQPAPVRGAGGCTGTTRAGAACNGNAGGTDGCARHKDR